MTSKPTATTTSSAIVGLLAVGLLGVGLLVAGLTSSPAAAHRVTAPTPPWSGTPATAAATLTPPPPPSQPPPPSPSASPTRSAGAGAGGAAGTSARDAAMYAVACTSQTHCMGVGAHAVSSAQNWRPLAEELTGTTWRLLPIPGPARMARALLTGISCQSSRDCVAVGYHYAGAGDAVLAQAWDGARWRIIESRNPAGAASAFLNGVSCTRQAGCLAVGSTTSRSGRTSALAERWAGGHWRVQPVPPPAGARATEFNDVSCAGRGCVAVGQQQDAAGRALALVMRWNGSAWRSQRAASVAGASLTVLQAVSCPAASLCMAVGYAYGRTVQRPIAERWQAGSWRLMPSASPAGGTLNGISCPPRKRCIAVGSVNGRPLSESWTGRAWRALWNGPISGAGGGELSQVSCEGADCIAVGLRSHPGQATLAGLWNGRAWRVLATRNP